VWERRSHAFPLKKALSWSSGSSSGGGSSSRGGGRTHRLLRFQFFLMPPVSGMEFKMLHMGVRSCPSYLLYYTALKI